MGPEGMHRREDDRMKEIHIRLDKQDEGQRKLETGVGECNNKLALMSQEIKHQAEMLANRFQIGDQASNMVQQRLETLSRDISMMGGDPSATPAGRAIVEKLNGIVVDVNKNVAILTDDIKTLANTVKSIAEWQTQVNAVISIAKWMGAANIFMMIYVLWETFGPHRGTP